MPSPPRRARRSRGLWPIVLAALLVAGSRSCGPDPPAPVTEEQRELFRQAWEQFDSGHLREAEKLYERLAVELPNSVNALTNLGMVRLRMGKMKYAEQALTKALTLAPQDE